MAFPLTIPGLLKTAVYPATAPVVVNSPGAEVPGLGTITIKQDVVTWNAIRTLSFKTGATQWTPVKYAWIKIDDATWERIYPTPQAVNTLSANTLSFSPYVNYYDGFQRITVTNTGERDLIIVNVVPSTAANTYTTVIDYTGMNSRGFPMTIAPNGTAYMDVTVYGNVAGTYNGNITMINNIGALGYGNTVIPVVATVQPDYSEITASINSLNIEYYTEDTPPTPSFTVTNSGNGGNLVVTSASLTVGGSVSSSSVSPGTQYSVFTVNTPALSEGVRRGTLNIVSNAKNASTLSIPVTINVVTPHGSVDYTSPGVYTWTVPAGVHHINLDAVGGGGGGGGNDASPGYHGFNGHRVVARIDVSAGDVFQLYVAGGGSAGSSGSGSGAGRSGGGYDGGGGGGNAGPRGVSGGGGGGGGASAIIRNGSRVLVAAGGGGGGGGGWHSAGRGQQGGSSGIPAGGAGASHPNDGGGGGGGGGGYNGGSGGGLLGGDEGAYSGNDGADLIPAGGSADTGVQFSDSGWYATGFESSRWCGFMGLYGIWTGGAWDVTSRAYSTTITFPQSGIYTFNMSADNTGYVAVDGSQVVSMGAENSYQSVAAGTAYVTAGTHTVTVAGNNYGGPAGIAAQIIAPSGEEIWNTLQATIATGSNRNAGDVAQNGGPGYVAISW